MKDSAALLSQDEPAVRCGLRREGASERTAGAAPKGSVVAVPLLGSQREPVVRANRHGSTLSMVPRDGPGRAYGPVHCRYTARTNEFQFHRRAEWQARNTKKEA